MMTGFGDHERLTTQHRPHADVRPQKRNATATEYDAPSHRPFPLREPPLRGRGGDAQRAEDVLSLQRTVGNRAACRVLQRRPDSPSAPAVIQREFVPSYRYKSLLGWISDSGKKGCPSLGQYQTIEQQYKTCLANGNLKGAFDAANSLLALYSQLHVRMKKDRNYWRSPSQQGVGLKRIKDCREKLIALMKELQTKMKSGNWEVSPSAAGGRQDGSALGGHRRISAHTRMAMEFVGAEDLLKD